MNKFQETLKKQIEYAEFTENSVICLDIEVAKGLLNTQTQTLEEVIQEWEALGYKVDITNREIEFTYLKSIKYISIDRKSKTYWCPFYLSLEEHQLLTKTFRALGWFNE